MHTKNGITSKLLGPVVRKYEKFISNIQEKRIKEQRTQLQAALMLGSVRRIK
jgi:hypothetical protein